MTTPLGRGPISTWYRMLGYAVGDRVEYLCWSDAYDEMAMPLWTLVCDDASDSAVREAMS